MDELNTRRNIYADPKGFDLDAVENVNNVKELSELQAQLKVMDKDIDDAFNVDVPEGLEGRILLQQALPHTEKRKNWQALLMGLAASFLIAIVFIQNQSAVHVNDIALQHVHEEHNELKQQVDVSTADINRVLNGLGYDMPQPMQHIKNVSRCHLSDGTDGAHFVLQGEHGVVTVLLMPQVKTATVDTFNDAGYFGLTQPMEKGSIAYLSEHQNESLNEIKKQFQYLRTI